MTFIYSVQTTAMLLPEIVNSSCISFKILPEYHLFYEILPESSRQEFLSRPSLTCKHFTHAMMLHSWPSYFWHYIKLFFNVSVSFTKKMPEHISSTTHRTLFIGLFVKWMEEQFIYFMLKHSLKSLSDQYLFFILPIKNCKSSFTV